VSARSPSPNASVAKRSAGFLLFRGRGAELEVLVGHMGGPFWTRKDDGAWSIPKGEYEDGEDPLAVARREFEEELGSPPPSSDTIPLGETKQASGKVVTVWAAEGDLDASACRSNTFRVEWPKGSGRMQEFPEIDRAGWFGLAEARRKLVKGQHVFLDRLADALAGSGRF
jgi:predicted NUDIX family NTP pyrophosphohydrolase